MENLEMSLQLSTNFWRDKNVLITGHTGFKGTWLSLLLHNLGARVHGYALPMEDSLNMFDQCSISELLASSVMGDICDGSKLKNAVLKIQPQIVFHLAAQPLVLESYQHPIRTFDVNIMGTANLLEAVKHCPSVKSCVVITTDKCYRNEEWEWGYRETDPLGGKDPYASSKACAELVVEAYRSSFLNLLGIPVATARAGNVIGGGDWASNRIVPDFFRAASTGEVLQIRNPTATRPWQHVLEPLAGYLALAAKLYKDGDFFASSWNFGPDLHGTETVETLVDHLLKSHPLRVNFVEKNLDSGKEANLLMLDSSRSRKFLEWDPKWSFHSSVNETASWYMSFLSGHDMRKKTFHQIDKYLSL